MNKQNTIILVLALALIGGTAVGMQRLKANQKLGKPGIKATAVPGSPRLDIYLPEYVLDYDSVVRPTGQDLLNGLPPDTSFMTRNFTLMDTNQAGRTDGILMNVVMMGTDRTSIHKPQFCLTGSGWNIDGAISSPDTVRIESPYPYDLPVMKLVSTRDVEETNGDKIRLRGIYVYWFVADHELTADHWTRMRKMATHLLSTGELQRWAYVSCFTRCFPGQENEAYERVKKFIASAVPKFQLATNPRVASNEPAQTASR
jgi:hypothetical protein